MNDAPLYGPFSWPSVAPAGRGWPLRPGATYVLVVLLGLLLMAGGSWLVKARLDAAVARDAACLETQRALVQRTPMLRHTVRTGDACRDARRMKGEDV